MTHTAKRKALINSLARAREMKRQKHDSNNKEDGGDPVEQSIAKVAPCSTSFHTSNELVSPAPASCSRPVQSIRFVFHPQSEQPPELFEGLYGSQGLNTDTRMHSIKEDLCDPTLCGEQNAQDSPSSHEQDASLLCDEADTTPRHPPSREHAKTALYELENLLHPPRTTGRGHKPCKLDMVTRTRYESIAACLRFFLRSSPTFIDASVDAATGAGHGTWHAQKLREWTQRFIATGDLPSNNYGQANHSVLQDEDIANDILLSLRAKGKYITAKDVSIFVNNSDTQRKHGLSKAVSCRTAQRWIHKIGYRWGPEKKGQYFDGHEREDVVQYRQTVFVPEWKALEPFMPSWDVDTGEELPLNLQPDERPVTVWCHDATTAYAHDRQNVRWVHISEHASPIKKGQGVSVMFADYVSARHGFLKGQNGTNARKILYAGKGRDGYMTNEDICVQIRNAVKLAKDEFPDEIHVFVYDNARIHTKRLAGVPSARYMTKNGSNFRVLTKDSDGKEIKIKMQNPRLPDGSEQQLYLPNGRFKGMVSLLKERGYVTEGLKAECRAGFKCDNLSANCCCRRILFNLIDMDGEQKSVLELLGEELGVRVIFLPKFHCELNPIEQCWGYAKRLYRMAPPSSLTADVEKNMLQALESIPLTSIQRFFARSCRFIDAYAKGLHGPNSDATRWAQKQYQSHRVTPEHIDL